MLKSNKEMIVNIIKRLGVAVVVIALSSSLLIGAPAQNKKPFLIQNSGLPHLTKQIKMMWNDKDLALTQKQKEQL